MTQFYGRMFPRTGAPVSAAAEEDLKRLGAAMRDSGQSDKFGTVAGVTYFGQFIDHDLSYDTTKLEERDLEPHEVRNFRTPRFDLELIYGGGPALSPHLYEGDRLKIGRTAAIPETEFSGGTFRDIARSEDRQPLHADPDDTRNLENLLVMQIHVLFINFHNAAVKQCHGDAFKDLPLPTTTFERAQQLVRWHYQWLVREYFLREIIRHDVLKEVWNPDKPKIKWEGKGFFIPAEFSLAAFRFGHSMVRSEYALNCHREPVPLASLMEQTKKAEPLREDWLIEWGRLFPGLRRSHTRVTPSSTINTAIAEPLHHLDEYTRRQFSVKSQEEQPRQLPVRTLLRGARAGLPTGQEVARQLVAQGLLDPRDLLGPDRLTGKVDATNDESGQDLAALPGLTEKTPLYYYLLKEAEVLGDANHTLGPVGSRIVAEVIEAALVNDQTSYLRTEGLGPNWLRPIWRFQSGGSGRIDSLTSLVRMLGDELPQGCRATLFSKVPGLGARVLRHLGAIPRALNFR